MKNIAAILLSLASMCVAAADQIDDIRSGYGIDFDLKGMNYSYTGAMSGSGTVLDADAPPACAPKDAGTLNFVLDTATLGMPFSVMLPMTGTKLASNRVRWNTDTLVNQCVTMVVTGTPTNVYIKRVVAQLTMTSSAQTPYFDTVCSRSYNVRLDHSGGNTANYINSEAYALCIQSIFTRIDFHAQDIDMVGYGGVGRISTGSFSLPRGIRISGDESSLADSDDAYMVMRPGVVLSSQEYPLQLVVNGTGTSINPTELRFKVESKANQANINQKIELYNFSTQAYEQFDLRPATTADTAVEVVVSANAANYVDQTDLSIRSKVSYKAFGPILSYPWIISVDQTVWTASP